MDTMSNRRIKRLLNKNSSRQLLILASLGLLLLLVVTFTVPFNKGLFSRIYTKPSSHAATPSLGSPFPGQLGLMSNCGLSNPAFCDNFSEGPYTGTLTNRGGDLDPTKWTFFRETEAENTGGLYYAFSPVTAQFCQTPLPGVLPDRDSFFCNGTNGTTTQFQGTEDMHWMTTMNDGDQYASIGARSLQPFDFSSTGTETFAFMVDAVTEGPHSTWPSMVISDQPLNMPHKTNPGVESPPQNGVQIDWNNGCGSPTPVTTSTGTHNYYPQTTVGMVTIFNNYQEIPLNMPFRDPSVSCVNAYPDRPNFIIVQVSQTSLDIYMADYISNMQPGMMSAMIAPTPKLIMHLDQSNGYSLNMMRGYVSFEQAQYAACKFNDTCQQTYHWHAMGFDGPVLPPDRDYQVPDSLTPRGDGTVNIGYYMQGTTMNTCCTSSGQNTSSPATFTLKNVDLTGAKSAFVVFNWRSDYYPPLNPMSIQVRANGNAWHDMFYVRDVLPNTGGVNGTTNAYVSIPLSELKQGTNSLDFNIPQAFAVVANIDLGVTNNVLPTPMPSRSSMPSMTPNPSMTPMPTSVPSSTPQSTSFNSSVSVTPVSVNPSQTVNLSSSVTNLSSQTVVGETKLTVIGPQASQVFSQIIPSTGTTQYVANTLNTQTTSFTLPANSISGSYTVDLKVLASDGVTVLYDNPNASSFSVNSLSTPTPTSTPMPSPSTLPGDFNGDGKVNISDLSIFSTSFGTSAPNIPNPLCDLNGDGVVNVTDLSIFSANFGK